MRVKSGLLLCAVFLSCIVVDAIGQPHVPPGPCCWPPTNRPAVNWWTFNGPSGTTSADLAGTFNNIGIDHGTIPRVGGSSFRAIQLQGAQWVQVANGNEVNFLGDCSTSNAENGTIAFWISASPATGVVTLVDKRETSSNFIRGYSVFLWNGRLGFQMATGTGNGSCNSAGSACSNFIATSLPSVADGSWHFAAISFSRCNTPTGLFYVDGSTAPFTPRTGSLANASDLFVGRNVPVLGTSNFTGLLDELAMFKFAYTKTELDTLFNDHCHNQQCWF